MPIYHNRSIVFVPKTGDSKMNTNDTFTLQSFFDWQHARRVSNLAFCIARKAGHSYKTAELIGDAAFYHDIGKIFLPSHILLKPGPLTENEYQWVQEHVQYGHDFISSLKPLHFELIADTALHHHERLDGSGYFGKTRKDLSPIICVTAIADVFDAMTSQRSYKDAVSVPKTLKYLQRNAGVLFEEKYVQTLFAFCE